MKWFVYLLINGVLDHIEGFERKADARNRVMWWQSHVNHYAFIA